MERIFMDKTWLDRVRAKQPKPGNFHEMCGSRLHRPYHYASITSVVQFFLRFFLKIFSVFSVTSVPPW